MIRTLALCALFFATTFTAYATGQRSVAASAPPAVTVAATTPPMWIPPSFDIETSPLTASVPADPYTPGFYEQ